MVQPPSSPRWGIEQIHHDIGPAQVVGVGLIGWGLVVALHHRLQVIPEGGGHAVLHPTGQGEEEAQPAVQEQQEERQPARTLLSAQLVGQQAVAGVGQQHHQSAGEGHRRIQRHPEQVERGRHRVRQIGIGHGGPQHQAVFQRELGVDDAGADGQMQA